MMKQFWIMVKQFLLYLLLDQGLLLMAVALWSLPTDVHADKRDGFSIVGVWMLKSETAPDGKVTPSIYTQYTRCKIYDADSTYYTVQLHAVGDDMMILAHEMGRYRLNDSIYMERDRVMPFTVIDDTTFITEFEGYKETMVRSTTMTEERKQEIRDLVRQYPDEAEAPVKHFVLSTTERQLKAENKVFMYIIIILVAATIGIGIYVYRLRKRKREIERKLAEIEEVNALRPEPVATAMKQVETEFFQSGLKRSEKPFFLVHSSWKVRDVLERTDCSACWKRSLPTLSNQRSKIIGNS